MSQSLATLGTVDPEGVVRFLLLDYAARGDGLREGRPGGAVLKLLLAGEELVVTLGTYVHTWGV